MPTLKQLKQLSKVIQKVIENPDALGHIETPPNLLDDFAAKAPQTKPLEPLLGYDKKGRMIGVKGVKDPPYTPEQVEKIESRLEEYPLNLDITPTGERAIRYYEPPSEKIQGKRWKRTFPEYGE